MSASTSPPGRAEIVSLRTRGKALEILKLENAGYALRLRIVDSLSRVSCKLAGTFPPFVIARSAVLRLQGRTVHS